ncbi:TetR family transcriptional regulator [Thalassomonas actiniarum]|uniref:TetR family transcriptional regulator n=1 Tax=Thalassomonas actiniarum TaxID=485447 RepID=A0AAE9YYC5_9GAMM|nr:TetR family transcriptional regulator [Thalassomonas actiniarum]WDE02619.1 TetR family transcriptional regulator [Thalassomonas actiniarum]
MARKTKEEAERTRKTLIHAALMHFSEHGVAHTTLNDISKAAGVTKGAFYWHFKNKLEIFEAIVEAYSQPLDEKATNMLEQAEEPLSGLFQSLAYYASEVEKSPELIALFTVSFYKCEYTRELTPLLKFDQQEVAKTKDIITTALKKLPDNGWQNNQEGNPELIATIAIDAVTGTLMRWCRDRQGSLSGQILDAAKIVLSGSGIRPALLEQAAASINPA